MSARWLALRAGVGTRLLDAPRYALALHMPRIGRLVGLSWETLRNRGERLSHHPEQRGVRCNWRWTSSLRYCERRPAAGLLLLKAALSEWPIAFEDGPTETTGAPQVSFIIGHRGTERLPLLLATIASIRAQENAAIECIVVEQSTEPFVRSALPPSVRYIHTPPPRRDVPYSRSWAFNVGARAAKGEWTVFHDNDVLVPKRYAAEILSVGDSGFEAARLQRFVFYVDRRGSDDILSSRSTLVQDARVNAVQNCEGHTLAVRRDTYWRVGGHDEAFEGWGGEDNEMFDRLRTRRLHDCSYLPFVHLHHEPQPGKGAQHANVGYFEERMRVPRTNRIAELSERPSGLLSGPISNARSVTGREIPA